ncbi:SLATT domain-containing protein [Geodermatophilus maliterrae]|uniref:SLATT domain-containing protein n=1 Tax=Geodermatophilus maliterrae TaxID=3162531 RepID=A0ABV3XD32_9ACTN
MAEKRPSGPTADILLQAIVYYVLAINKDNAHFAMAERLQARHKAFGVPATITSVIVSTAIFTTLQEEAALGWKISTGLLSLVAAVLTALQTFFNYA